MPRLNLLRFSIKSEIGRMLACVVEANAIFCVASLGLMDSILKISFSLLPARTASSILKIRLRCVSALIELYLSPTDSA